MDALILPALYVLTAGFYDQAHRRGLWTQHRLHHVPPTNTGHIVRRVFELFTIQTVLQWAAPSPPSSPATYGEVDAVVASAARVVAATVVIDTYQYWLHRLMHAVPRLYRHMHSTHHDHRKTQPWAALYNSYAESIVGDVASFALAQWLCALSHSETLVVGALGVCKTVSDHSGYVLPWDPFSHFANNAAYHQRHHTHPGVNFEQPFYTVWDRALGTRGSA